MITGGCICGKTRYEADQEPGNAFLCQCTDCQKITGTGHGALMLLKLETLTLSGTFKQHDRALDNGNVASHVFCSECGSPLINRTSGYPEICFLHAGSLDDKSLYEPKSVAFRESCRPWDLKDPEA